MNFTGFDTYLTKLPDASPSAAAPSPAYSPAPAFPAAAPVSALPLTDNPIDSVILSLQEGAKTVGEIIPLANSSLAAAMSTVETLKSLDFAVAEGDKITLTPKGQQAAALISR